MSDCYWTSAAACHLALLRVDSIPSRLPLPFRPSESAGYSLLQMFLRLILLHFLPSLQPFAGLQQLLKSFLEALVFSNPTRVYYSNQLLSCVFVSKNKAISNRFSEFKLQFTVHMRYYPLASLDTRHHTGTCLLSAISHMARSTLL